MRPVVICPFRGRNAVRSRRTAQVVRAAVAATCLLVVGCKQQDQADQASSKAKPVTRTAERGPVSLTVTCDKDEITIAERLGLTIAVEAADGVDATLPQFGQKLSEFQIRNFKDRSAVPVDGKRRWEQDYDLDIFLSGDYTIPAITVSFVDHRPADRDSSAEPIKGELSTEPIPIKVTSLLAGQFDPTKFRDIKGPVPLPAARTWIWLWWTGGGLLVIVAVVSVVWLIRRWRRPGRVPAIPPHEWAFDQLRALIDAQLVEQGQVQEFYYRLSEIVRVYIELRFGLMAPERTTEEFLIEAHASPALSAEHKRRLADFLQACDLVKFARYAPATDEVEQVFNAARDFIDQTAVSAERERLEAAA
jgi:hypothetical protein